jgi:enoyl-CoA hydratase/carnithine racemase
MSLVSYELSPAGSDAAVATIRMDDGKVNVLSIAMQDELRAALDRAEADGAAVLLTGREGVFSAGFDLPVLMARDERSEAMAQGGFQLAYRLLSYPAPVVIACSGHAIAMGLFLLFSGDYRIGAAGQYKLTANEVTFGVPVPTTAIEILRQRLAPATVLRATALAEPFSPANAVQTGFLDRVVEPAELMAAATGVAVALAALDRPSHALTKQRVRAALIATLDQSMVTDGFAPAG